MIKACLLLLFCLQLSTTWAHQPDVSSTVLMEQKDGSWILQIKAALTAFEYEIEATKGSQSYATPEEFRTLVLHHLQNNISIDCNGEPLALQEGYVQLGHETNVLFKVMGMPDSLKNIQVTNTSFKDIHHNQSALMLLKKGFQQQQFVLNNNNQHTAHLKALSTSFQQLDLAASTATNIPLLLIAIGLSVLLGLLYIYRQKVLLA